MLNDPLVHNLASVWAKAVLAKPGKAEDRVKGMYLAAYGRRATTEEIAACLEFVKGKEQQRAQVKTHRWRSLGSDPRT